MPLSGSFRHSVWDPALIISQIVAIQCIMYFFTGLLILLMHFLVGAHLSLDCVYKIEELNLKGVIGRTIIAIFLIIALLNAASIWFLVGRTKLCLDFSTTIHILHLLFCWHYSGFFPKTATWWITNILCVAITCVCAEFLCLRSEMKAIPIGGGPKVDL
nr:EOG090X0FH3 [Artemia franciscana]